MAKYKKKPVEIEAFRFRTDNMNEWPEWFKNFAKDKIVLCKNYMVCIIDTPKGYLAANEGDYIIKGIQDEIYPCKPDIFLTTYEEVNNEF